MIVRVSGDVEIVDADDCKRLHVETDLSLACVAAVLERYGLGTVVEHRVEFDLISLKARALAASTASDWDGAWADMIRFAVTKGWVDLAAHTICAHVTGFTD